MIAWEWLILAFALGVFFGATAGVLGLMIFIGGRDRKEREEDW